MPSETDLPDGILRTPEGIYVLRDDTHLSRWIELHKRLDVAEDQIAHFKKYIPEGGTVIDAGASLGDHTATYAKLVGPGGHVFAFEPNPLAYECLVRNMESFPWVHCYQRALFDFEGVDNLKLETNTGASHIAAMDIGTVQVATVTLDGFLREVDRVDFIHLDCEGIEPRILFGGTELITRCRPAIVLEVNHPVLQRQGMTADSVYQAIADLGYRWQEAYPGHHPDMEQRDILCLPYERIHAS